MHRHLSKLKFAAAVLVAFGAPITAAQAATLTTVRYESTVDVQKTNFDKFVNLPKFDPSLGELQRVFVQLGSEVRGSIRLENLDAQPAYVTANLAAEVSLLKPDRSILLTTLPTASIAQQFAADDEVLDYGGLSGATYNNLSNSKTASTSLTSGFDWFVGLDTLTLPVTAVAKSAGTGAGNLAQIFNTLAGAKVEVVYEYYIKKPEQPKRKVPESSVPLSVATVGVCILLKSKYRLIIE
ncbi:MAG: choice-of-anchor E domain-containing protein [Calothrix sp. C42_A2020_038]|nr:choice-of-anchor E domain-containing protein [Calothrix sp. C42_A2020_038]